MFELEHHQQIQFILNSLDSSIFHETGAAFGGGTLITLLNDEYRWSKDIDFICPVGNGYKKLRELVFDSMHKPAVFFSKTDRLCFPRDLVANQYGIRFSVVIDGKPIKFEIVAEGRISLGELEQLDWLSVPSLGFDDQCTEKLLANADRWNDSSIESRDLIDLAVLRLNKKISDDAINKAESAYSVIKPLQSALEEFQSKRGYRDSCFEALEVKDSAMILEGINLLRQDFI